MVFRSVKLLRYNKCTRDFLNYASGKEVKVDVPWGFLAGKWYGKTNRRPILALHSLKDNCGIWDRFIRDLGRQRSSFLVVDLPGHGLSSKLPQGVPYDWRNYALSVHYLVQHFRWPEVSLMGHSSGGIIGYFYALMFPNVSNYLIWLDASKDREIEGLNSEQVYMFAQLKQFYVEAGLREDLVPYMLERNISRLKRSSDQFYLHTDPRIKNLDPYIITGRELKIPTMISSTNIKADHYDLLNKPSLYSEMVENFLEQHEDGIKLNHQTPKFAQNCI